MEANQIRWPFVRRPTSAYTVAIKCSCGVPVLAQARSLVSTAMLEVSTPGTAERSIVRPKSSRRSPISDSEQQEPRQSWRRLAVQLQETIGPALMRKLIVGAAVSAVLALMEGAALALVYPLMLTIVAIESGDLPSQVSWIARLVGSYEPARISVVLGAATVFFFFFKSGLTVAFLRWSLNVVTVAEAQARTRLLGRYLSAPLEFHFKHNSAEMHRTLSVSLQRVYREVVVFTMTGLADAMVLMMVALVLLAVQPAVALAAVAYFLAVGFGYQRTLHGRAQATTSALHDGLALSHQLVHQSLISVKDLKVFGRQHFFLDNLGDVERELAPRQATVMLMTNLPRYYLELALISGVGMMAGISFWLLETAEAVAVVGLFLAAGFRSLPSLNRLLIALATLRIAAPSIGQVHEDLGELEEFDQARETRHAVAVRTGRHGSASAKPPSTLPTRSVAPTIRFSDVWYRYPGRDAYALQGFTAEFIAGEMVGVVGPSGAGKTTLVDVLLGLLAPERGTIEVDGQPLDPLNPWTSVGYVPQQIALLDDTLAANIAFGAERDPARLADVVERCELSALVAQLPDGLETVIGESGSRLSGGQRQRIGIARAIYEDPRLLVLDEATAALDPETEARIGRTLDNMRADRTVFVIAHRLSTVRSCSRLLLLQDGRVVATGSFEHLLGTNELFRRFVQAGEATSGEGESSTHQRSLP